MYLLVEHACYDSLNTLYSITIPRGVSRNLPDVDVLILKKKPTVMGTQDYMPSWSREGTDNIY